MGLRPLLAVLVLSVVSCSHSGSTEVTTHRLTVGSTTRTWHEFRPAHLPARPAPLLLVFHGYQGIPLDMLGPTGLAAEARRDGFIIGLPVGLDSGWNADTCCGASTADDVGFTAKLISSLVTNGTVDPTRVFAAGFSNGAMFAYRLGCQLASALAGVAVVEGTMTAACPIHPPVDLLVIHQTGDTIVPFAGTTEPQPALVVRAPFPSVAASLATWEQAEGCGRPQPVTPVISLCPAGKRVGLDLIQGGSHVWPGGATAEIAGFFALRT